MNNPDRLTILTHNSLLLAKQWQPDGTIKGYDKPKHFAVREAEVTSIGELSALLTELESDRRSCVIRGGLKVPNSTGLKKVRRIKANFDDVPHHWVMIEVDKYEPLTADPVAEAEAACLEYIECALPAEFKIASFHWQLSGSAGHASKARFLKAHIWFWLSEARDSLSLRDWAEGEGIECDKAVFDEIQVHYTARPLMARGIADPVTRRSGLRRGEVDEVVIDIPVVEMAGGKDRKAGNWQGAEDEFSLVLEEKGKVKGRGRDGSVYIECPWIAGHSMKGGDNETVYWPAGTGGYELGHFDCRHDSCRGREDGDFVWALGLMDDEFGPLGEMGGEERKAKDNKDRFIRIPADVFSEGEEGEWLIDNILPEGGMAMMFGESGSGKTFAALDIAAAIARGSKWRDKDVKQRCVIYIAAEGASGVRKRLKAYKRQHNNTFGDYFDIIADTPNFLLKDHLQLAKSINKSGKAKVIIIDTLAQTTPGANENISDDMGKALAHCRYLQRECAATIILIHHSGKDQARGARGWSGIKAAMDTELEVIRKDNVRIIKVTKQKDGEDGATFPFRLIPVEIGETRDGKPIESCVLEHLAAEPGDTIIKHPKGKWQEAVYLAVHTLYEGEPLTIRAVIEEAIKNEAYDPGRDINKPLRDRRADKARQVIGQLCRDGFIVLVEDKIDLPQLP